MKKYLFIAAAALTMMAGCNKYKVEVGNPTDQIVDNDTAPVAVMLSAATNTVDVKTKAAMESWNGDSIFVYAIQRTSTAPIDTLIENKMAAVASDGNVALWAEDPVSGTEETDGVPYYYLEGDVYDFYGYYLGTKKEGEATSYIKASPTANGTTITVPVTITGAEDIMIAKADPKKDVAKSTKPDLNIANYNQYVYGSVAARRGVQPNLVFEHVLTRFTFLVKDGLAEASGLKVFGIKSPETENSTATLTVVGDERGISQPGTPKTLEVAIPNGAVDVAGYSATVEEGTDPLWANAGDLMLFEGGNSKVFEFSIGEDADNVQKVNVTVKCPGDENATFEAGKKYVVSVRVYGPEAVTATAEIAEWGQVLVPEIDSNTLPVQKFTLIDGSMLTYDGTTLKTGANAETLVAVAGAATFYTTNGFIFTYTPADGENPASVTIAEAQVLDVTTLEGVTVSVKAYHYVTEAAAPVAGHYIYVTGEGAHYGTFTLVYDGVTYTVETGDDFVVDSASAVTEPVTPAEQNITYENSNDGVLAIDGTTLTITVPEGGSAKYVIAEAAKTLASEITNDYSAPITLNETDKNKVVSVEVTDVESNKKYYQITVPNE